MATSSGGCRQALDPYPPDFPAGILSPPSSHAPAVSQLDASARRLRDALLSLTLPLAAAARVFVDGSGWHEYGYARLSDHARERLGRSARWVRDLAALHDAVQRLPVLSAAITGGDDGRPLPLEAARQLGRVADPSSLSTWLSLARGCSCRALKHHVRSALAAGSSCPLMGSSPAVRGADQPAAVCLLVPSAVREAFTEAHDLYQAIEGFAAPVGNFIESLLAEASSGALAGRLDLGADVLASPDPISQADEPDEPALGTLAANTQDKAPAGGGRETPMSVRQADKAMRHIIALQGSLERRLARFLTRMAYSACWRSLGYRNLGDYAEHCLGWSRSTLYNRVQMERRLRRLPIVRQAYQDGSLNLSAAQAIADFLAGAASFGVFPLRVPKQVQQAWVDRGTRATMKRLQDEIRAAARQVAAERKRIEASERHPTPLSDIAWHSSLRRRAGSAYRLIRLLGAEALDRPGPLVPLRLILPSGTARDLRQTLAATRGHPHLVQMFSNRHDGVPEWAALLALLGEFVATWDIDLANRRPSSQRIYVRDGWRCMAPGCTSRRNLETHHVVYRSQGGGDELENLVCLCRFHHQMGEHGSLARVRGVAPLGLVWELGKNGIGGRFRNEIRLSS